MISRSEALNLLNSHLTDEGKLTHSIRVAELMESMARQFHLQTEKLISFATPKLPNSA